MSRDFFGYRNPPGDGGSDSGGDVLNVLREERLGEYLTPDNIPNRAVLIPHVTTSEALGALTNTAKEGDLCTFGVSGAVSSYVWLLRYSEPLSGATPDTPWNVIGGPELTSYVATDETTTTVSLTTPVDMATVGPSITVPLEGVYTVSWGAEPYESATAGNTLFTWTVYIAPGAGAVVFGVIDSYHGVINTASAGGVTQKVTVTASKGTELRMRYSLAGAGTGHFRERWMTVEPLRVGP